MGEEGRQATGARAEATEREETSMIYKRGMQWHMDVTIRGVRYRESPDPTDRREALNLEKDRIAEIQAGKRASLSSREFARTAFAAAAEEFLQDRRPQVAERTLQLERNLLAPLRKYFGDTALRKIKPNDIGSYQKSRRQTGISGRTLNMEVRVLRQLLK